MRDWNLQGRNRDARLARAASLVPSLAGGKRVPTADARALLEAVLEPGDLVNTGTPQGVALSGRFPYLSVDDVMEIEIDGLGRQRQVLVKG